MSGTIFGLGFGIPYGIFQGAEHSGVMIGEIMKGVLQKRATCGTIYKTDGLGIKDTQSQRNTQRISKVFYS